MGTARDQTGRSWPAAIRDQDDPEERGVAAGAGRIGPTLFGHPEILALAHGDLRHALEQVNDDEPGRRGFERRSQKNRITEPKILKRRSVSSSVARLIVRALSRS